MIADELPMAWNGVDVPSTTIQVMEDVLVPRAHQLRRETRARPSLEASVGFGLSLGALAVAAIAGEANAATAAATVASPATLMISWLRARREGADARLALGTLLDFSLPSIDPRALTEDNRGDLDSAVLPYFGVAPGPPHRERWGVFTR